MGTKFAPATGSNTVTQFDKGFNVKFRASRLRHRLTLDGHQPTVATSSFLASRQVMR